MANHILLIYSLPHLIFAGLFFCWVFISLSLSLFLSNKPTHHLFPWCGLGWFICRLYDLNTFHIYFFLKNNCVGVKFRKSWPPCHMKNACKSFMKHSRVWRRVIEWYWQIFYDEKCSGEKEDNDNNNEEESVCVFLYDSVLKQVYRFCVRYFLV